MQYPPVLPVYSEKHMWVARFVFDNLFNMMLLIILMNIVLGIIIDTFGSLREELDDYEKDLSNYCFICGFDKETIEKESTNQRGFRYHIKVNNNDLYNSKNTTNGTIFSTWHTY